jgi:hypothetical protein
VLQGQIGNLQPDGDGSGYRGSGHDGSERHLPLFVSMEQQHLAIPSVQHASDDDGLGIDE